MLVLTADIGEGHDLPARIIKADLEAEIPGAEVEIENGLEAMGKLSAAVAARRLESHLPLDALAVRHPVLADHQVRADPLALPSPRLLALGAAACCALIDGHDPDVVISTYPG